MTLNWINLRFLLILLLPNQKGIAQNQLEVCAAIAAGLVRLRLTGPYVSKSQRLSLEGRTIQIPNPLSLDMLDWERSVPRPGFGWRIDPPLDPPWNESVSFYLELNFEDLDKIWGATFKAGFSYPHLPDTAKAKPVDEIISPRKAAWRLGIVPAAAGVKRTRQSTP